MIFIIVAVIMSAVVHEYMHGFVAYKLGDNTAEAAGRLTLNPMAHLDPVGSIILPFLLIFSGSPFVLAWAKPVPYNPYNLTDPKYGDLKVALGGPLSNFILAVIFGTIARLIPLGAMKATLISGFFSGDFGYILAEMSGSLAASVFMMSVIICFINLILMFFNLIPIPPLDGSKILLPFLPTDWKIRFHQVERFGILIILLLLMSGLLNIIFMPMIYLFRFIVGF